MDNFPVDDFSKIDWNDPASIFRSLGGGAGTNLPIPKMLSPEQVRMQARELSAQIFTNWELLIAILDRHELTIHKRWLKKTKNQRIATLLAAWPKMSTAHRPDFLAIRKENEREREIGTKFRDAYMWPYINLDDLSKPKTLLLFLQARARNTPDSFAVADYDAGHLGHVTKAIVPHFLNEYTMMFTNRKTPGAYGELVSWEENDDAFEWLVSGKGMHPGQGLVVLEVQQRIICFLVDCCKRIMHDISADDLVSDTYLIQPPVTLTGETVNGFASLAVMAAETPYRLPASMDLVRLESLFAARKSSAEDHVWALREDPGYFADALREFKGHCQEMLKDTNGRNHPLFTMGREDIFWQRVIKNAITQAHLGLEVWTELHAQLKELRILQVKHEDNISIEKDLPGEYLSAILTFQHYLNQAAQGCGGQLQHSVTASPPICQFFVRLPPKDPNSPIIQIAQKPGVKMEKVQADLLWLLKTIWENDRDLFLIGLTNIVDELERLVQSDPKAKAFLSSYIADVVSDLTIISEAIRQLKMYQPWAQTFENSLAEKEEDIMKGFAHRTKGWGLVMAALDGPSQTKTIRIGEPGGKKFYYPVDKRRTKGNVEAMRSAEQNLDAFWLAVDQNMRTRMGNQLEGTALRTLLSQSRVLQRTSEWVEPDNQAKKNQKPDVMAITKPLSELYFDLEQKTERTIDRSSRTTKSHLSKPKTRGVAAPTTPTTETMASGEELDIPTTFELDARALKVFRTLFYTPSLNATPGEVPWTDFLHAMVSAGFEPEKLYGSVWHFRPTKLDVERSIQFHEPHPSGKLSYTTARHFGRRLNRAYGWEGEMFVLREVFASEEKRPEL